MIFVFGSNLLGIHGAGAAKTAKAQYGAETGVGVGRTGNAYAIPTKRRPSKETRQLALSEINKYVDEFIAYVDANPDLRFFVARVGCGLAGYTDAEISPMFKPLIDRANVKLPPEWRDIYSTQAFEEE